MNPFYFGRADRPLFGAYHPAGTPGVGRAVVLCYPVAGEYLRAHRAFRQLTNLLVRGGIHVLRFDYFGTGDSAGDAEDATVEGWLEDVGTAVTELKDSTGLDRVWLAGLRVGATLSALASQDRQDVAGLVLWDPIASGRAWLPPEATALGGFPIGGPLRQGIEGMDLREVRPPAGSDVHVVVSSHDPSLRDQAAAWTDPQRSVVAGYRCVPSEGDWSKGDRFGSALIPQSIILGVVESLASGAAR